jgi:hypothetical protein
MAAEAVTAAAVMAGGAVATACISAAVAAMCFTAAASAVVPCFMVAVFAMADSPSGIGTSTTGAFLDPLITDRPTIIPIGAATSSGPITARAVSAISGIGTAGITTGVITTAGIIAITGKLAA